jgi:hypothetical protein
MKNEVTQKVLESIRSELPEYFPIDGQTIFSPKTIYNELSKGTGPEIVPIRGKIFLERDSFVAWLGDRSQHTVKRGRKRKVA